MVEFIGCVEFGVSIKCYNHLSYPEERSVCVIVTLYTSYVDFEVILVKNLSYLVENTVTMWHGISCSVLGAY